MGVVRTEERKKKEIEELRRMIVACAAVQRRKDEEQERLFKGATRSTEDYDEDEKVVCVTSGVSFLGSAIVKRLLLRGYCVRIIVDNPEDMEKLREMERDGETRIGNGNNSERPSKVKVVEAKLTQLDDVASALDGCRGVFHTSSFSDPAGLSGYSKSMAEIDVRATENVMKACSRVDSVRKCVLTSSLLACVWGDRDDTVHDLPPVINHDSWSDESLCMNKKLWYALGKLRSEKAAWRIAEENGFKLATVCPGLVTGREFFQRNPTATIAYLKGAQEMYKNGLLATVDVMRLAEAHICVYEEMNNTTFGRYICFDNIIENEAEAEQLAEEMEVPTNKICGGGLCSSSSSNKFHLSNRKLTSLMSRRTLRSCSNES